MHHLRAALLTILLFAGCASAQPAPTWHSEAAGRDLPMTLTLPPGATTRPASVPGVIVLNDLATGITPAQATAALDQLARSGNAVITLDYDHHPNASADLLVKDLLKIRADIKEKKLVLDGSIDVNRLWILPEGVALERDVTFFKNDQKAWQLDIAYPIGAASPAPTLMEITCDNASRMGNASLVFCHDTLLEGALLRGFAAAMIDHPVPAPYKGLDDPMPDLIHRLKSAVRTIRSRSDALRLSGTIGAVGFSRGGPMAAFLAVTNGRAEFEVGGEHAGVSSDVQAALIHGNRYDYSQLRDDDPMLARFAKAWGPREQNQEKWLAHGAAYYLRDEAAPMFLNTSDTESAEYRDGLERFHARLMEKGATAVLQIDQDGRGHRVSTEPRTLATIYTFFARALAE